MNTKRSNYIDIYKGIAILCITLLHYESGIFPNWITTFIGGFMVYAFYATSGWIMGGKNKIPNTEEFARKRLKSLGVPYLWFTIIFLFFDFILFLFNYYDTAFLTREIYKTITLRGIGTLWFLPAIFFGEVMLVYILKKRLWLQLTLITFALLYSYAYDYWLDNFRNISTTMQIIDSPLRTIFSAMTAFIILYYTYYVSKLYKINIKSTTLSIKIILMVLLLGFYFWFLFNPTTLPSFNIITNAALVFGMFIFSYIINKIALLNNFFIFWGKNSLIMMLTHYTIIQVICEIVNKYCLNNDAFTGYITIVFFVITVLIEYPIVWFMNRNKYCQYILGKQ